MNDPQDTTPSTPPKKYQNTKAYKRLQVEAHTELKALGVLLRARNEARTKTKRNYLDRKIEKARSLSLDYLSKMSAIESLDTETERLEDESDTTPE